MCPVLTSPFKSPIAVLSKLKHWSSFRKSNWEDSRENGSGGGECRSTPTTPLLTQSHQEYHGNDPPWNQNHPMCRDSECPEIIDNDSDLYCTPMIGRATLVKTPDSGIHTGGPVSLKRSGRVSKRSDRMYATSRVSSPIPINNNNATLASFHQPRQQQYLCSAFLKNRCQPPSTRINNDTSSPPSKSMRLQSVIYHNNQDRENSGYATSDESNVTASVATTTTTLLSYEDSPREFSHHEESWCLKLSDLDSPDCLSPHAASWQVNITDSDQNAKVYSVANFSNESMTHTDHSNSNNEVDPLAFSNIDMNQDNICDPNINTGVSLAYPPFCSNENICNENHLIYVHSAAQNSIEDMTNEGMKRQHTEVQRDLTSDLNTQQHLDDWSDGEFVCRVRNDSVGCVDLLLHHNTNITEEVNEVKFYFGRE